MAGVVKNIIIMVRRRLIRMILNHHILVNLEIFSHLMLLGDGAYFTDHLSVLRSPVRFDDLGK